ncbi:hypothetical protein GW17_00056533 [Ensete ventricosum]|nr:hypothetical protein GW17_00056533 [Ensete ventricosum]
MYIPSVMAKMANPSINPFDRKWKEYATEDEKMAAIEQWIAEHGKEPNAAIGLQASHISWDDGNCSYEAGEIYLTCRQLSAVRGVAGWSARRIRSTMPPTAYCQGCCRLVGPSCLLCHAAICLLSRVPHADRPIASALPCHAVGRPLSSALWIDRDSGSFS